jgi:hypothetical protein
MNRHHGRGRPPLPRGQVCEHRVVTFLNDGIRQKIGDLATRDGKSISQTCRDLIITAIDSIDRQENDHSNNGRDESDTKKN